MMTRARAEALCQELVDGTRLERLCATSADVDAIRATLDPLRRAGDLAVTTCSVNALRVDIELYAGLTQWRLVYFVDDADVVTDVHLWRRPDVYPGCAGLALIVNGPSGAGKSSLMRAVAAGDPRPWVVFDEPRFGVVRQDYLIWPDTAPLLQDGYLRGIAALAAAGNLVLASAAGTDAATIVDAFTSVTTIRVGLTCSLDELRRREHGRDGRAGGLAESTLDVHDGWEYDLTFDTTDCSAETIAAIVIDTVDAELS